MRLDRGAAGDGAVGPRHESQLPSQLEPGQRQAVRRQQRVDGWSIVRDGPFDLDHPQHSPKVTGSSRGSPARVAAAAAPAAVAATAPTGSAGLAAFTMTLY